ncbi:MAG TPA: hypothetical protein VKZ58_10920 [Longimicrobiales bacterium]|nr:hypothetical protein [Longimicrobiales bacterium]
MARLLDSTPRQVRVVFRIDEVQDFLRGREPVPGFGGEDPLNRAIQRCYDGLNDAFPDAGEFVEVFVEAAPWVRDGDYQWYAVNFRFADDRVRRAGHDPDSLADWIAEYTPDLLFTVEDERGHPAKISLPRARPGGLTGSGARHRRGWRGSGV